MRRRSRSHRYNIRVTKEIV